jgi:hypothetical protein
LAKICDFGYAGRGHKTLTQLHMPVKTLSAGIPTTYSMRCTFGLHSLLLALQHRLQGLIRLRVLRHDSWGLMSDLNTPHAGRLQVL